MNKFQKETSATINDRTNDKLANGTTSKIELKACAKIVVNRKEELLNEI
jgi:hypothetical protein